mmetsp:Transcript_24046/g.67580  ORF Transcript_24046/g.67580 Transcript_24046/m.67580 type:complete len:245 (+) Transcript_24046:2-736(+)
MRRALRGALEADAERLRAQGDAHSATSGAADERMLSLGRAKAAALGAALCRPAPGAVAFVGSSTFTFWRRLREDFPERRVYNAAFGGSGTADQLDDEMFDDLVAQHRPSCVVYFCGSNDVARGRSAAFAAEGFRRFFERVRRQLGLEVRIVYLAIGITPLFREMPGVAPEALLSNERVKCFCESSGDAELRFVDCNSLPWASDTASYLGDGHHLNDEGHRLLADALRPHLGACGLMAARRDAKL